MTVRRQFSGVSRLDLTGDDALQVLCNCEHKIREWSNEYSKKLQESMEDKEGIKYGGYMIQKEALESGGGEAVVREEEIRP